MAKVITFSRIFPAYHPRKGEPTFFAEKFLSSLNIAPADFSEQLSNIVDVFGYFNGEYDPKNHTIRAGNRFKAGDYFSPRVWSGKPYNSKQIIIAHDIEIENIMDIEIVGSTSNGKHLGLGAIYINGKMFFDWHELAKNDGLSLDDMESWFTDLPFKGQIICWNKNINY